MIQKIGVIYQDRSSLGFLRGLCDRLKCKAELIEPPAAIGKPRLLPRRCTKLAWLYFLKRGVDLVVRFTDADTGRWQETRREELNRVPEDAKSIWICGVAANNPEDWLCLDLDYLAGVLDFSPQDLVNPQNRIGQIKRALVRLRRDEEGESDVVERLVRGVPGEIFRRWLRDEALKTFYTDCRAAAARVKCKTPNELGRVRNG